MQTTFDPNFGFQLLLPIFAAVVLGGIGSAYGALAGGLVARARDGALDVAVASSAASTPSTSPSSRSSMLAVALMVRPQGLFGRARVV